MQQPYSYERNFPFLVWSVKLKINEYKEVREWEGNVT